MSIKDDIKKHEKEQKIIKALKEKAGNSLIIKVVYEPYEKVSKKGKKYIDYKKVTYVLK